MAATVNSVSDKAVVDSFVLDAKRVGDLVDAPDVSSNVTAIKGKTDNLPSDPADESLIIAATDAIMTRIGANGGNLTSLGDTRLAHLDADVSSRLAPAGTLANLTNAPTAGDFTAAMKTSLNAATPTVSVGAVTLANNAITTAAIQDGAITDAKITVPAVSGVATGVLSMLVQLWRRFFRKVDKDSAGGTIKTYANDGTSVLTTQTITSVGTTDTQGPAS